MKRWILALVAILVVAIIGVGSFTGGMVVGRTLDIPIPSSSGATTLAKLTTQVHDIIAGSALEPSSDDSMTTNAIDGMLKSLGDPYAVYFTPKEFTEFERSQTGEFYGIGVTIGLNKDGQPQIGQVFPSTPASRAGLKALDVIVSVNGVKKAKWDLDAFVQGVRGPVGTKVTLVVKRGTEAPFTVVVTRERITVPNVVTKSFGSGVAYIGLMTFNERAAQDVRAAITKADARGAKGYILDLRGNPGGLLTSAVDIASLFVPDGVIVRVDARGKPEDELRATGQSMTRKPLVVLIDAHSASASEIVAGALQDYGRAVLVGEKSYGKGSVQTIEPLANGGGMKLTTAHYLTPKKRVINKKGVVPDVVVKMDARLQADTAKDTQLQRAIAILRSTS
jgi:carboxyl-terminal processing protease